MPAALRLAMWSGPRNISTAMMRAWGNRPDTFVCDEPLYGHYLMHNPQLDHPGRDEVIAYHETDWHTVVARLTGPVPHGKTIFYQKHMAHHLLDNIERDWLDKLTHCFLIREPMEMLTSLVKHLPSPTLADTGLPQQWELVQLVRGRTGSVPPILDARDVLENPRGMLERVCESLGVPFLEEMLSWPAGPRETDGIWAKHWYGVVERSTCFQPYRRKNEDLPDDLRGLLAACEDHYGRLYSLRLHH